jgi:hypothetical protein
VLVGRMTDELERMWKKEIMAWLGSFVDIYLGGMRSPMKASSQDNQWPSLDSKQAPQSASLERYC